MVSYREVSRIAPCTQRAGSPGDRKGAAGDSFLRKNGLFWSFPYVCPEPVLVNVRFFSIKHGAKKAFPHQPERCTAREDPCKARVIPEEKRSFLEFSPCLSRACLSKMIVYIYINGSKRPCLLTRWRPQSGGRHSQCSSP